MELLSNLDLLPSEMVTELLIKLNVADLAKFCLTSKRIKAICDNDMFWKEKYRRDFSQLLSMEEIGELQSMKNLPWKEKYRLAHSVPHSPISVGVKHYAILNDQKMLHVGNSDNQYRYGPYSENILMTPPYKQKIRSVSCGNYFTGVVTEEGKVYFWGKGLADIFNSESYISMPREYQIPGKAIKISCGPKEEIIDSDDQAMFAVILEDRSVFLRLDYVGLSFRQHLVIINGIISTGDDISKRNIKASDISVNGDSLAIVSTDGKLYYLGKDIGVSYHKTVGITSEGNQIVINPVHIPLPETIKQVSLGFDHIGVLSTKGNIYLWGSNLHGQLGQGFNRRRLMGEGYHISRPEKITFPVPISFIICQNNTTAVIDEKGKLYIWGYSGSIKPYNHVGLEDIIIIADRVNNTIIGDNLPGNDIIRPIPIEIKSSGGVTIDKFNYIDIGTKFMMVTTNDGWVNKWTEDN